MLQETTRKSPDQTVPNPPKKEGCPESADLLAFGKCDCQFTISVWLVCNTTVNHGDSPRLPDGAETDAGK